MIKCLKCGYQNIGGKFCVKCGTALSFGDPETIAKMDILQKRIAQDTLNPKLYLELGELYQKSELVNESLLEYQKVINIDSSNFEANLRTGKIYLELSKPDQAKKFLQKALEGQPASLDVKIGLFNTYYWTGEFDSAISIGEEIVKSEEKNIEIQKILLTLYEKNKLDDKAKKQIEIMLKLAPNDKGVLTEAADFYAKRSDSEKAIKYYSDLVLLDPDNASVTLALGHLLCMAGRYKQCVQLFTDKVNSYNTDDEFIAKIYLTYSNLKLGNITENIDYLLQLESSTKIAFDIADKMIYAETFFEIGKW